MELFQDIIRIVLLCVVCIIASGNKYRVLHLSNWWIIAFLLLICLIPTGGDYVHYETVFNDFKTSGFTANLEEGYIPILQISWSYIVFRIIIWGSALGLVLFSFRRLGISINTGLFFFASLFVYIFSYVRVSLAMAIVIAGFSFLIGSTQKNSRISILRLLIGIALLYVSLLFHKSIGVMVLCIPLSFLNLKSKDFIILAMLFPVLVFVANHYLMDYLSGLQFIEDNELISEAITVQSEGDKMVYGIGKKMSQILLYSPLYILQIFFQYDIYKGSITINKGEKRALDFAFFIVYLSSVFAFLNFGTRVIYYRFLYMAYLPTILACSSILNSKMMYKSKYKIVMIIAIVAQVYSMAYDTYLTAL